MGENDRQKERELKESEKQEEASTWKAVSSEDVMETLKRLKNRTCTFFSCKFAGSSGTRGRSVYIIVLFVSV